MRLCQVFVFRKESYRFTSAKLISGQRMIQNADFVCCRVHTEVQVYYMRFYFILKYKSTVRCCSRQKRVRVLYNKLYANDKFCLRRRQVMWFEMPRQSRRSQCPHVCWRLTRPINVYIWTAKNLTLRSITIQRQNLRE